MHRGMLQQLTGLGPDVLMTPGLKRKVKKAQAKDKRMEEFYMGPGESLDSMRDRVRDALRKRSKGKGGDGKSIGCDYAWIKELAPGKAVYERNGKCYGCSWRNENGEVKLGPEFEVEERKEYVTVGGKRGKGGGGDNDKGEDKDSDD